MIACLHGTVEATGDDYVVLMVYGVGYKVFTPNPYALAGDARLHTSLIVREDSLTLYGFDTTAEKDIFEILLKVNGVGPRMALAILSHTTVDNLRAAVFNERAEILTRVPGVGKKTAQKIVLELKDKMGSGLDIAPVAVFDDINSDVIDTLVALGYSIVEAQSAIQALPREAPDSVEERVRLALQYFA